DSSTLTRSDSIGITDFSTSRATDFRSRLPQMEFGFVSVLRRPDLYSTAKLRWVFFTQGLWGFLEMPARCSALTSRKYRLLRFSSSPAATISSLGSPSGEEARSIRRI